MKRDELVNGVREAILQSIESGKSYEEVGNDFSIDAKLAEIVYHKEKFRRLCSDSDVHRQIMTPHYFIVGATENDAPTDKAFYDFIHNGYWRMFWPAGYNQSFDNAIKSMRKGDRIAIKIMLGPTSTMRIRAIGIITGKTDTGVVLVDWVETNIQNRVVNKKNCMGTVYGPYKESDDPDWIRSIFLI